MNKLNREKEDKENSRKINNLTLFIKTLDNINERHIKFWMVKDREDKIKVEIRVEIIITKDLGINEITKIILIITIIRNIRHKTLQITFLIRQLEELK